MRKKKKGRKLSRKADQRKALLSQLVSDLVLKEKIKTTEAKAKEIRPLAEKAITLSKKQSLAARQLLIARFSESAAKKLINDLGKRYEKRPGGYTRIVKLGSRFGDAAKMAIIELIK